MKSKRNLLVILIILSLYLKIIYAQFGGGTESYEIVNPASQVFNPSELTQANPVEGVFNPGDGFSGISSVGEGTSVQTGSGLLSDIVGSYNLIMKSGQIVEGVIISSKNDNVVPALNLLDGSLVFYNLQAGDKVIVDQIGGDGVMGDEYNARMDKGVSADINKDLGNVRFTAYGKDSLLKIKPTEEPSYEFNNGLLEYESSNVLEQINTSRANSANVDRDYETGFKCLTLAGDANYNYEDKVKPDRSFSIKNLNKQDYRICVKKTVYDEYQLINDRYGLIDLVKDNVKLKAKVLYEKKRSAVYESLDDRNDAEIETSLGVTKLLIVNKAPSSTTVSKTYAGNHVITEKLDTKKIVRVHEFSKEKHPELINLYSTAFKPEQPDITIKDNLLVQAGKNRFTAMTENNKCFKLLGKLLSYEEEDSFYDEC